MQKLELASGAQLHHLRMALMHLCDVCGIEATSFETLQNKYISYFEDECGRPAVYVFDGSVNEGWLYLGRSGNRELYPVVEGKVADLVLSDVESIWLFNCWHTAMMMNSKTVKVAVGF